MGYKSCLLYVLGKRLLLVPRGQAGDWGLSHRHFDIPHFPIPLGTEGDILGHLFFWNVNFFRFCWMGGTQCQSGGDATFSKVPQGCQAGGLRPDFSEPPKGNFLTGWATSKTKEWGLPVLCPCPNPTRQITAKKKTPQVFFFSVSKICPAPPSGRIPKKSAKYNQKGHHNTRKNNKCANNSM